MTWPGLIRSGPPRSSAPVRDRLRAPDRPRAPARPLARATASGARSASDWAGSTPWISTGGSSEPQAASGRTRRKASRRIIERAKWSPECTPLAASFSPTRGRRRGRAPPATAARGRGRCTPRGSASMRAAIMGGGGRWPKNASAHSATRTRTAGLWRLASASATSSSGTASTNVCSHPSGTTAGRIARITNPARTIPARPVHTARIAPPMTRAPSSPASAVARGVAGSVPDCVTTSMGRSSRVRLAWMDVLRPPRSVRPEKAGKRTSAYSR